MNLFILDQDPDTAARLQCDKHIVKMVLKLYDLQNPVKQIKNTGV